MTREELHQRIVDILREQDYGHAAQPCGRMTAVVGIDLSLTATGVCAVDGSLHTIKSAPSGDSVAERAARIIRVTNDVIAHIPTNVSLVVLEGPAYSQQAQAGVHLRAGLWWSVATTLMGQRVVEVSPSLLKKFATGKGNATKPDMRMALFQRADLDVRDDNQVDAWWLRQLGLHLIESPDRIALPQSHTVALAKVTVPFFDGIPF